MHLIVLIYAVNCSQTYQCRHTFCCRHRSESKRTFNSTYRSKSRHTLNFTYKPENRHTFNCTDTHKSRHIFTFLYVPIHTYTHKYFWPSFSRPLQTHRDSYEKHTHTYTPINTHTYTPVYLYVIKVFANSQEELIPKTACHEVDAPWTRCKQWSLTILMSLFREG